MFRSVLIANRGEIARRIIRTAKNLGIRTIAVYSEADASSPFVREADHALPIGPSPARESYLVPEKILAAAKASNAEAIHPGYGFLSENADFAEAVIAANKIWIGPPPAAIRAMGLKDAAKALMHHAGVRTTPGYLGADQSDEKLQAESTKIGFPLLIKAVAGGGGKGMRRVNAASEFLPALESCRREAQSAFGDPRVLLEIYVQKPRHLEIQIFGDSHGNIVHLFERDCSIQRRHQKIIEEAPAPGITPGVREFLTHAALAAGRAVKYEGAGTIEFIADASEGLRADRIWFMEMNTRLQVEHPVTEAVTGLDLVEWQFLIAAGQRIPLEQHEITLTGHAIEARLYAENPDTGFLPSTGPLTHLRLPDAGIRIDSAVEQGNEVTGFYDPMIAKLIAHAPTRDLAARKLAAACRATEVYPVKTNAAFLAKTLSHEAFLEAELDTGFLDRHLDQLLGDPTPSAAAQQAAAHAQLPKNIPTHLQGFRLNAAKHLTIRLAAGNQTVEIPLTHPAPPLTVVKTPEHTIVFEHGRAHLFTPPTAETAAHHAASDGAILAPMPGTILAVPLAAGTAVKKGDTILIMEAMKMELSLTAPFDGTLTTLSATPGAKIPEGTLLAQVTPTP